MATMTDNPRVYEPRESNEQREIRGAHLIERQTAKVPSDLFVWASLASIAGSFILQSTAQRRYLGMPSRRGQLSLFIGQWAPTFLMLGVYSKLSKLLGTERG
jgi:hypothetical protein